MFFHHSPYREGCREPSIRCRAMSAVPDSSIGREQEKKGGKKKTAHRRKTFRVPLRLLLHECRMNVERAAQQRFD